MTDKLIEDLVESVRSDETFARAFEELSDDERANLEVSVRAFAELLAPFLRAVESLSVDEAATTIAKAKLSEKLFGR